MGIEASAKDRRLVYSLIRSEKTAMIHNVQATKIRFATEIHRGAPVGEYRYPMASKMEQIPAIAEATPRGVAKAVSQRGIK
jgi:hypothetical protein